VPTEKAGTQQLDGQDLGERHPGHCTDDCRFGADVKAVDGWRAARAPSRYPLGFSGRDGTRTSAAAAREHVAAIKDSMESG
jgi:hypothetical protein